MPQPPYSCQVQDLGHGQGAVPLQDAKAQAERGLVLEYLRRTTGLSRSQVSKLMGRSQRDRRRPGRPFASKYTRADIAALAELDGEHLRLSGPATRKLCQRAWEVYGDVRYERLAGISNRHVYNLRQTASRGNRRTRANRRIPGHDRYPPPRSQHGPIEFLGLGPRTLRTNRGG